MRHRPLLPLLFVLSACSSLMPTKEVDPAKLPPMTGQERALLISADASANAGDYVSAERNYLTAIAQSKGHIVAHLSLGRLYTAQGKADKAEEILEKALELQPRNPEANLQMGKLSLQEEKPEEALHYFEQGLRSDQANLDLLTGAGIADDLQHKHRAAQIIYLKALALHPGDDLIATKNNLAMSYLLDNNPKKVVELLKGEARKPDAPAVVRHNLALAYGALGKHVEARKLLNGEVSEEERVQSIKRLTEHIEADQQKVQHPADKIEKKTNIKPSAMPRSELQPAVHQK